MTPPRCSPDMETPLLPCPFCGGKAAIVLGMIQTVRTVDVACQDCGGAMPAFCEEDAVGDWNIRTGSVAQAQPIAPKDLHWLGDRESADATRHAMDMTGCVMYFAQQSDCLQFMRWVSQLSSTYGKPPVGSQLGGAEIVNSISREAGDTSLPSTAHDSAHPLCSCKASQRDGQHMMWCPVSLTHAAPLTVWPSTGSFLGYHDDASGNEMHCRHMTCPHEIDCRKRCICPTAVTLQEGK